MMGIVQAATVLSWLPFTLIALSSPVNADDTGVDVDSADNGIFIEVKDNFSDNTEDPDPDPVQTESPINFPTEALPTLPCYGPAAVANLGETLTCPSEESETQTLTPGMVAAAFARIPLPPSKLIVQPPNGRTLVNLETNFFTKTETFTRSVTLLGQRIQLTITPATFAWRFGDGETTSTASPGSAYPDLEITHSYLRKGRVTPSVDTTYTATYRVNGGPSQPVPGSVTIPGEPVPLRVITASPQLVG